MERLITTNKNQKSMDQEIRKSTDKNGNESITYRKSWDKNGIHFSKEIRKVEGGYIIRESKYGKPSDDPEAEYIDESKEYASTENPLEKKKKDDDEKMFSFVDLPMF